VDESNGFCGHCGTRLYKAPGPPSREDAFPAPGASALPPQGQEYVLLSFGPFGVNTCNGPYSIWRLHRKNSTIVELTNLHILGIANTRLGIGKLVPIIKTSRMPPASFEIPYASIISAQLYPHPLNLGMMKVLDIRYRVGESIAETSICYYNHTLERAYDIVRAHASPGIKN